MRQHSKQFWDKKYATYKTKLKAAKAKATYNMARFRPLSKTRFKQAWELITQTDDKLNYLVTAQITETTLDEAREIRKKFAEQGINVSIKEVREEGTFNLAKKYNLSNVYQRLRAEGKSVEEAQEWISYTYFGSM